MAISGSIRLLRKDDSTAGIWMDWIQRVYARAVLATVMRPMTSVRDTFETDAKVHERYDELYHGVYKQMYKRLRPLYQVMRKK
jgi:hypothetical protein